MHLGHIELSTLLEGKECSNKLFIPWSFQARCNNEKVLGIKTSEVASRPFGLFCKPASDHAKPRTKHRK